MIFSSLDPSKGVLATIVFAEELVLTVVKEAEVLECCSVPGAGLFLLSKDDVTL